MEDQNPLVGKTISAIYLADHQGAIKFDLDDSTTVEALCDGDCCSHTWIEEIINHEAAIGSPVTKVEEIDLPEEFCGLTKTDHFEEEMQFYGCAIETAKGRCTIAYRNSSNGYYGGRLAWPSDDDHYYYGGVFGQNKSNKEWKLITEDK